jgi:hypothetical protein
MKTLLVSVLFALAGVACSSDNTAPLTTSSSAGTVAQDGVCNQSSDCAAPLECGFPVVNDAGSCQATGFCVSMVQCTYQTVCPCGGSVMTSVCETPTYASAPVSPAGTGCAAGPSDAAAGGSTTGG